MRKTFVMAALAGLSLLAGSSAYAADVAPHGDRPFCDARWSAMSPAAGKSGPDYTGFLNRCVQTCPTHELSEARSLYSGRTHRFCDLRWKDMQQAKTIAEMTYRAFIDSCSQRCLPARAATQAHGGPSNVELGLAGALATAAIGGAVASGRRGAPASP